MEDKRKRMEELVARLNRAGRAYYQESRELISNQEYDKLYDELQRLETETGIVLANSPTVHVGYEVISSLPGVTALQARSLPAMRGCSIISLCRSRRRMSW